MRNVVNIVLRISAEFLGNIKFSEEVLCLGSKVLRLILNFIINFNFYVLRSVEIMYNAIILFDSTINAILMPRFINNYYFTI